MISFADENGGKDSAVTLIRAAAGGERVNIQLGGGYEEVSPGLSALLPGEGLVLDKAGSPALVIIDGAGAVIALARPGGCPLVTVGAGVRLELRNITLKGAADNRAPLVKVEGAGAKLVLGGGAAVTGNASSGPGGGVLVSGGGTLELSGGAVADNRAAAGGGVYAGEGGTFVMTEGSVSGNRAAASGGGVYVAGTGTFIMAGGTIRANKVLPGKDGGVNMGGTGTFIMTGGTISGNKALQDRGGRVFVGSGGIFSKGKAGGLSPGPAG